MPYTILAMNAIEIFRTYHWVRYYLKNKTLTNGKKHTERSTQQQDCNSFPLFYGRIDAKADVSKQRSAASFRGPVRRNRIVANEH